MNRRARIGAAPWRTAASKHPPRRARIAAATIIVIALIFPQSAFALNSANTEPAAKGRPGQAAFESHKGYYSSWSSIDHALKVGADYAHKPFGKYTDKDGNEHETVYGAFGDSSAQQDGYDKAVEYNSTIVNAVRGSTSASHWGFNVKNGKAAGKFGVTAKGAHVWKTGEAEPVAIDIKITVTDYTVLGDPDYAYIAIQKNHASPNVVLLGVKEAELTYEYFLHGTDTPYSLKTNLTYSDVDDHQYVAVGSSHVQGIYLDPKTKLNYGRTGGKNMFFADMDPVDGAGAANAVGFAFSSGADGFTLTFGNDESDGFVDYAWFGSSVYGMFMPEIPDPWKDVSDGDEEHVERNCLADAGETFTYNIYQDVPGGIAPSEEFGSFVMRDQIDACLEILSVSVYNTAAGARSRRAHWTAGGADGSGSNDWFDISVSAGNLVTATAKASALGSDSFYGGSGRIDTRKTLEIAVRWNPAVNDVARAAHGHAIVGKGSLKPSARDGWKVMNQGTVSIDGEAKNTGAVETDVYVPHKEVSDSNESLVASNTLANAAEPFYYTVSQYVPAKSAEDKKYTSFAFADQIESCLEVTDVKVFRDGLGTDASGSFDITNAGGNIRAAAKPAALQNAAFYGHEYTVKITVRLRQGVGEATLRAHGHYVDSDRALRYANQGRVAVNDRPDVGTETVFTKAPVPDLRIEKSVSPYENQVGGTFRYTVKVSHTAASAGDAVNVRVWDTDLPNSVSISGITVSGISAAGKSVVATRGGFELRADALKLSETAVISFDASAFKELNGKIVTNTAFVSSFSDTSGDWASPKSDGAEVYINSPKLNVVKTAQTDGGEIGKGDEIHYKAVVTNVNPGTFMRDCIFFDEITQAGVRLIPGSITVKNSANRLITSRCDITVSGNAFRVEPLSPLNIAYKDMAVPPKQLGRNIGFQSVAADYADLPLESRVTVEYSVNISDPGLINGSIVNTMVSPSRPNTDGKVIEDDPDIPSGGGEDTHETAVHRDDEPEPPEPDGGTGIIFTPPGGSVTNIDISVTAAAVNIVTPAATDILTPAAAKAKNEKRLPQRAPKTGDGFNPIGVALIMGCAGALTLAMLIRRRPL
jgi:fimbrial isopeptide formation D2 family protein